MRALILAMLLLALPVRATELKLATWNLDWLTLRPADLPPDRGLRSNPDLDRLAAYAKRLDADVVALQEVDGPQAAARIFDPAEYAFFFPAEDDIQRAGFAVRRTLRASQNPDLAGLDLYPQARHSLRRGTDVTIAIGGHHLRLLSVHLKAGCRDAPLGSRMRECETLGRQADILASWVAARQRDRVPFVLLGDFNRALHGPGIDPLSPQAIEMPLIRVTEGRSNPCWAGARGGRPFIDHIVLGGAAREWLQPDSLRVLVYAEREPAWRERLSDHCPVSIRLKPG